MKNSIYKLVLTCAIILITCTLSVSGQNTKALTKSACRIYSDIENSSSVKGYVPIGKEVEVLEVVNEYLLIKYNDFEGYILREKTDMALVAEQETTDTNYNIPDLPTDRFSILAQKYGYTTAKALFENKIWKGIDHNMVKDSWGKPLKVSREVNSSVTIEIWTYRRSWLKLRDGILSEWGPNRR